MLNPARSISLRIVRADEILPHEIADPGREARIERRLRADGLLRDPLLVGSVQDLDGYVLLDGTNRKRALASLELPYALVQNLDYSDTHAVELRGWCHLADMSVEELLASSGSIEGVEVESLHPLEVVDALREPATLAVVVDGARRMVLRRAAGGSAPRPSQLRALVDVYETCMRREDCEPENVEERASMLARRRSSPFSLVAFPRLTRAQVLRMAVEDRPIPAGITRHIVHAGRALRVNVPLDMLSAARSLEQANEELLSHLDSLRPRAYQEPTVLFDS